SRSASTPCASRCISTPTRRGASSTSWWRTPRSGRRSSTRSRSRSRSTLAWPEPDLASAGASRPSRLQESRAMRTATAPLDETSDGATGGDLLGRVRQIVETDLAPIVGRIDREGLYPEAVLRRLGDVGAFTLHVDTARPGAAGDLAASIDAMAAAGELCLSTAFCMWCQNALGWYLWNADNPAPRAALGAAVAAGRTLGGTGLSNPMKCFFGIEPMRLKGRRVAGGYEVSGGLPWVSNLGADHYFGAIFEREDDPVRRVMAIVHCGQDGVVLGEGTRFLALDGTRTMSVRLRRAFIADAMVVADPIDDFVKRIRAGFILLQTGMAFGLIQGCV